MNFFILIKKIKYCFLYLIYLFFILILKILLLKPLFDAKIFVFRFVPIDAGKINLFHVDLSALIVRIASILPFF